MPLGDFYQQRPSKADSYTKCNLIQQKIEIALNFAKKLVKK